MYSRQLVEPNVNMKNNTQPTMFSDSEPSGRVFSTWIYTKVPEKRKPKTSWKLLLPQTDNSCFHYSWSVPCPLPFSSPRLPQRAGRLFLWWCGNATSVKLGAASKSSHISCLPLWNIFVLSKLAGTFQRTEFLPCRWEGSQDLEIMF